MRKEERDTGKAGPGPSIFVDSSGWIAFFSRRDQHHAEADRLLRSAIVSNKRLITSDLILAEVHRLLLFRAGSSAAIAALQRIDSSGLVRIEFADDRIHRSAMEFLKKHIGHRITYADAVSFSIMDAAGCGKAITFDAHFRLAGYL